MASGLPVIAIRVGGNVATVEDQATGLLVPPGDPEALGKAVIRLIENPGVAADLAARARHRIVAEFSMERMLGRVHEVYRDALARVPR
jgi:glycosyltransferase involved in cell wall biosynthesis